MTAYNINVRIFLCLFLLTGFFSGCSTTKKFAKSVSNIPSKITESISSDDRPALRAMLLPILDYGSYGEERTANITLQYIEAFEQISRIKISESPPDFTWPTMEKMPEFGVTPPHELADFAKAHGVDAVITIILNPIENQTEVSGIWPFKSIAVQLNISSIVNVIDVPSSTILASHEAKEHIAYPVSELEFQEESDVYDRIVKKIFPELIAEQIGSVRSSLREIPWTGKIVALETNGDLVINAGTDISLKPGIKLNVFEEGDSITCKSGIKLFLRGKNIGDIVISDVSETTAKATPAIKKNEDEISFKIGQSVRIKK